MTRPRSPVTLILTALLFAAPGFPRSAAAAGCGTVVEVPDEIAALMGNSGNGAPQVCEPVRFGDRLPPAGPSQSSQPAPPSQAAPPPRRTTAPPPRRAASRVPQAISGAHLRDEAVALVTGGRNEADNVARSLGLTVVSVRPSLLLGNTLARFRIPDGRTVPSVLAQLARAPGIDQPAPNHLFDLQAGTSGALGFAFKHIQLDAVAGRVSGRGVRVAIIDSAVDRDHAALRGAIAATFDALPELAVRERAHATAIAGLIAGRGRGDQAGVAPGAELLIARAFDIGSSGKASSRTDAILAALDWAVGERAQVINMSFAGPRNGLIARALQAASQRGVVLIAAAGNNGPRAPFAYPGAENSVLAVTATDHRDRIYVKANRGRYVFAAAPGVDLIAPTPGGGIGLVTGTSFSAAVLSGVAALVIERSPGRTPSAIAQTIAKTARDLGKPGRDKIFGAGLANAAGATGIAGP